MRCSFLSAPSEISYALPCNGIWAICVCDLLGKKKGFCSLSNARFLAPLISLKRIIVQFYFRFHFSIISVRVLLKLLQPENIVFKFLLNKLEISIIRRSILKNLWDQLTLPISLSFATGSS